MPLAARCAPLALFLFVQTLPAADKVAAVVNGEPVTAAEVDAAVAQLPPPTSPLSTIQKRQQRADVLQLLVEDRLVRQFLRKHGPKVDPADVERQLAALEASQRAEGKSAEQYLKEVGLTPAQARDNFLRMLQLAKYLEAQATDERLRAYFEANRDFFDKTTVRTSHIVLRVPATATTAEREKAVEKLRALRAELLAGRVEFAAAAKTYSQCPSAPTGGDVGWIVRKFQVDEAYARTAFGMKAGELSDVVETEVGFHLIRVTDRKPGKPGRYEDAAADVRESFEAELKQALLADLRKKAVVEIKKD